MQHKIFKTMENNGRRSDLWRAWMIQHRPAEPVKSEGSRLSAASRWSSLHACMHDDSRGKPFCNHQIWRKRPSARLLPHTHVKHPAGCHMIAWWHHLARGEKLRKHSPHEYARRITSSLTTHRSNNKWNLTWSQLLPDTSRADAELVSCTQTPGHPLLKAG